METQPQKQSLYSIAITFLGTLLVITVARKIAHGNPYIYFIFPLSWFLILFYRDIKTKKELLKNQWEIFKKRKWINMGLILLLVVCLNFVIQFSRPMFNQFIPEKQPVTYNFNLDTGIGLLFTVLTGGLNLMVAFVEEIAYRYEGMYVFKSKKIYCIIMLIISSILFGFSHYYNFGGSFLATGPYILAGTVLGIFYLFSKNIWIPILGHVIFNSIDILSSLFLVIAHILSVFRQKR